MDSAGPPTPDRILGDLWAFRRSAALKAAIELDLFSKIAEGAGTVEAIASACGASTHGTRILCDFLTIGGHLLKEGSCYRLPPESASFLDRRSPAYIGTASTFIVAPEMAAYMLNESKSFVVKGGTTFRAGTSVKPENPIWVEFARYMAPLVAPLTVALAEVLQVAVAGPLDVLDIAAGHGLFGIAIATRNPKARITAVDWSAVLEVAAENASKAGVAERIQKLPGSAFEVDLGTGRDLALVTNFVHHFSRSQSIQFLRRLHNALKPGDRVAVLDFMPNPDRITPPIAASFAFTMLAMTEEGDAYTTEEHQAMLEEAGFRGPRIRELGVSEHRVAIAEA